MLSVPERVIGVAASAGGVEALRELVAALPDDLDAAVCVVLHLPPTGPSVLWSILDRVTRLKVVVAEHGAPLERGVVYVTPNDHHLEVREDRLRLSRGPKENGVRPAADPLFRSIAGTWGRRGVAVVLSGALDDGAAGAAVVKEAGGRVFVQAPEEALVPGMPTATIAATTPDAVLRLAALAERLVSDTPAREEAPVSTEPNPAEILQGPRRPEGPATGFTCPACSGALWELREGELVRYRCRVGHAYSEEAMIDAQGAALEAALWSALEALEERSELLQRVAARTTTHTRTRTRFETAAREAAERAATIRGVLAIDPEAAA